MSLLTDEEKIELLRTALTALGKLYQDLTYAPAISLVHTEQPSPSPNQEVRDGIILFPKFGSDRNTQAEASEYSQEEMIKMPKLKDGKFRITPDGYYQVRYRREGYDVQFTSKSKKEIVEKFREWVRSVGNEKKKQSGSKKREERFGDFALRYFETVKKVNVSEETYESVMRQFRLHIRPQFGELSVKAISPLMCQELLNGLIAAGKGRTAENVKILLKEIFRAAIGGNLIKQNPVEFVKIPKHRQKNGTALSREEVFAFIRMCESSHYQKQFMLFLYTGIRRNELHSAVFDENFVTVANGKCRKGDVQTYRKIPIASELRKYLPLSEKELATANKVLSNVFKRDFPSHHLYDLRHTFTTYCQEFGIPKAVVDVWTGHVNRSDMTSSVYTHFSEEFQLEEIKKFHFFPLSEG